HQAVLDHIQHRKIYRRRTFLRFLPLDYNQPLPLKTESFDLLLSIYAPGIARACKRYLRPGGLLLSNNHQDDAGYAARDPDFKLIAIIRQARKSLQIEHQELAQYFIPLPEPTRARLQRGHANPERRYTQDADYYLFRKS
ncbi:MAG: hypothetical protein JW862_07075, partial [Anaerolineales bacterium]|nr:hypothetical protein [Anaerolineales bacterium]